MSRCFCNIFDSTEDKKWWPGATLTIELSLINQDNYNSYKYSDFICICNHCYTH